MCLLNFLYMLYIHYFQSAIFVLAKLLLVVSWYWTAREQTAQHGMSLTNLSKKAIISIVLLSEKQMLKQEIQKFMGFSEGDCKWLIINISVANMEQVLYINVASFIYMWNRQWCIFSNSEPWFIFCTSMLAFTSSWIGLSYSRRNEKIFSLQ